MKKIVWFFGISLITDSVAAAKDFPSAEAFLGYNFVRFDASSSKIAGFNGLPSFDLHGGNAQLVYNFRPDIGLVFDVGAVHAGSLFSIVNGSTPNQSGVDHMLTNFVLGPRYTFHRHSRWMPYAQALFRVP